MFLLSYKKLIFVLKIELVYQLYGSGGWYSPEEFIYSVQNYAYSFKNNKTNTDSHLTVDFNFLIIIGADIYVILTAAKLIKIHKL